MTYQRYPDGCYAVVIGVWRGPCAHSKVEALRRFRKNGIINLAVNGN